MDPSALRVAPRVPWHMWGNTERFELTVGVGGSREEVGQQLCKVSYKRPENWRFFFGGRLLGGVAGVGGNIDVYALFDLQIGVGRSAFDTQNERFTQFRSFCTMHWRVPAGTIPGAQVDNTKYTSRVLGTPLMDSAPTVRPELDLVPAEDIQVRARMYIDLAPSTVTVIGELTCFLAPNVHARPDWFAEDAREMFLGQETGGS